MKTAILVALMLSLVTSALPVAAHDWVAPDQGPLRRSIATEAARLAAVQMKNDVKGDADDSAWARLQKVERGTAVDVLDRTGSVTRGRLAEADDRSLTLRDGPLTNRLARTDVIEVATTGKRGDRLPALQAAPHWHVPGLPDRAGHRVFTMRWKLHGRENNVRRDDRRAARRPGVRRLLRFGRTKSRVIYRASQAFLLRLLERTPNRASAVQPVFASA
jgi:hypothetical protein